MERKESMRKLVVVSLLLLCLPTVALAGGIMNKTNWSTEYIRTLNRNASTDSPDAAAYNPAGVMTFDNGRSFNLTLQQVEKDYWHTMGASRFETTEPSLVPQLFAVYKKDRWAGYFAFTIVGGGGKLIFPNGSVTTSGIGQQVIAASGGAFNAIKSQHLEAESHYLGYTFGGAWRLDDRLTYSFGLRFVDAERDIDGSMVLSGVAPDTPQSVHYMETADGWGWILGMNYVLDDRTNVAFRYESSTELSFTTHEIADTVGAVNDGSTFNRDLPGLLGFGISHRLKNDLRLETNLTYYLNKDATWSLNPTMTGVDNGYDFGVALEYDYTDRLTGSIGYLYTNVAMAADQMTPEWPELDAQTIGFGARYHVKADRYLNLGILMADYQSDTTTTGIGLNKEVLIYSLGLQSEF